MLLTWSFVFGWQQCRFLIWYFKFVIVICLSLSTCADVLLTVVDFLSFVQIAAYLSFAFLCNVIFLICYFKIVIVIFFCLCWHEFAFLLIGKGSYGSVYKARDIKTSELVAIKVITMSEGVCSDLCSCNRQNYCLFSRKDFLFL